MSDPAVRNRINEHLAGSSPDHLGDLMGSDSSLPATTDSAGTDTGAAASGLGPPRVPGYRVIALLGRGAMGTVWQAHDLTLERDVAIKLLHLPSGEEDAASTRVLREARAAGRLDHPNAVRLHHVSRDGGQISIVMELLSGGSLSDLVERNGPMPWRKATIAIREAAEGLGAAHAAGLVHRDIKPSNLLRSANGHVKVADFGVARAGGLQSQLTTPGAIIGTPAYMSPEQCRGEEAGLQCDLYGLGCTYYHLLTGKPPFSGDATAVMRQHCHEPFPDASQLVPGVPSSALEVIDKLTRKSASERYASTTELIADLDRLLAPEAVPDPTVSPSRADSASAAMGRGVIAVMLSLIVAGSAGGWGVWRWSHRHGSVTGVQSPSARPMSLPAPKLPSPPRAILAFQGLRWTIDRVGFSPDGRFVWSVGHREVMLDGEARRWEVSTGGPVGQTGSRTAISPASDIVVIQYAGGGLAQRIDATTPLFKFPSEPVPLAVSPDDRLMANGELQADLHTHVVIRTLPDGKEWYKAESINPQSAKFSPDSRYLAIDDHDGGLLRVCDMTTRLELWHEQYTKYGSSVLTFNGDGSRILRLDTDMTAKAVTRVYQAATGRILTLIHPGSGIVAAALSPNGRFVVFAMADHPQVLRMWDVDGDQESTAFTPATTPVSCVCVSPDNSRALVGCEDGSLHLLSLPGGSEIFKLTGHANKVTAIAFSADGRMAASGSDDKTVRVWGLP